MRKRLFISVELSDAARAKLAHAFRDVPIVSDCRTMPEENWHITVLFLGMMEDEHMPAILSAMESVAQSHEQFTIRLEKIGVMPPNRPRMLWAFGSDKSSAFIAELNAALQEDLQARDVPFEVEAAGAKPPIAHITLARCEVIREALPETPIRIETRASELILMESDSDKSGRFYVPLAHFPLKGAL